MTGDVLREEDERKDQGVSGRVPEVWRDSAPLQYHETQKNVHSVGPERWIKHLVGADWSEMTDQCTQWSLLLQFSGFPDPCSGKSIVKLLFDSKLTLLNEDSRLGLHEGALHHPPLY